MDAFLAGHSLHSFSWQTDINIMLCFFNFQTHDSYCKLQSEYCYALVLYSLHCQLL